MAPTSDHSPSPATATRGTVDAPGGCPTGRSGRYRPESGSRRSVQKGMPPAGTVPAVTTANPWRS